MSAFHGLLASFAVGFSYCSSRANTFIRASSIFASGSSRARCLRAVIYGRTSGQNVASVTRLTLADGLVFLREAERVLAAKVLDHAGDFASVIVTTFVS